MASNVIPDKSSEAKIAEVLQALSASDDFPKFIIDVGANINASISAPFIEENWDCLLIEPQEYCAKILKEKYSHRTNVEILVYGCSDTDTNAILFHGKDGAGSEVSTLSTAHDPWMDRVRDNNSTESIELKTLNRILSERRNAAKDIGILKVDTESWDYYVLAGLDFKIHRPRIVVTEEYLWAIDLQIKKHRLLEFAGDSG